MALDLIYANADFEDVGVLKDVTLDMAYGTDENDFECTIALASHCMDEGYIVYCDQTEYGGVVDAFEVDVDAKTITYSGRSWHGVLESSIIEPSGNSAYSVDGNAKNVINAVLTKQGMNNRFVADDSEVVINNYAFTKWAGVYTGLRQMAQAHNAKLQMYASTDGLIHIKCVEIDNYAEEDDWNDATTSFTAKRIGNAVNHLICVAQDDSANYATIHLFTDENGGIKPYANVAYPYRDSDYIRNKSQQEIFGLNEICEVYDAGSVSDTIKYKPVTSKQVGDWKANCTKYHKSVVDSDGSVSYEQYEINYTDKWVLTTAKPADWNTNYSSYATDTSGTAVTLQNTYQLLTARPADWNTAYNTKYYQTDGTTYSPVSSATKNRYVLTTVRPSDWSTSFGSYYRKNKKGKFVSVSSLTKWKRNTFYKQESESIPPTWRTNAYYKVTATSVPTWSANTYYKNTPTATYPAFENGNTFLECTDHFESMVQSGIEYIKEQWATEVSIDFEPDKQFDVGDLIAVVEETTGLDETQMITKKIIKIERGIEYISYEVGAID